MTKRVGVIGGSFNPPHLGHLEMAKVAKEKLQLDEVWLMPAVIISHKNVAENAKVSYDERFKMCQLLAEPYSDWLKVSDRERYQPTAETYFTLRMLRLRYQGQKHQFIWIMGDDSFLDLPNWSNWREIVTCNSLAVFIRNHTKEELQQSKVFTDLGISFADGLKESCIKDYKLFLLRTTSAFTMMSSTFAREYNLLSVPEGVENYIREKGFYSTK